ncbi:hypothetical protein EMIT0347P_10500 [Pseudomonas sp. IT-347P]
MSKCSFLQLDQPMKMIRHNHPRQRFGEALLLCLPELMDD